MSSPRHSRKLLELEVGWPASTSLAPGLAGSLLAILLAKRGFKVTVYERRPDPRIACVDRRPLHQHGACAARGIRGLKLAGVLERVMTLRHSHARPHGA